MIFNSKRDIPRYFLVLRYLSWFGYANENLLINQFKGIKSIDCDNAEETDCFKRFSNGDDVLDFYKINPENFSFNILSLSILIVGWRILAFLVLLIKSRQK